jgi:putative heme-binding domain-containing protein
MASTRNKLCLFSISALVLAGFSVSALEPWANQSLRITNGLELWLDAARENQARSEEFRRGEALARVPNGAPLDIWHDASGKRRHVIQFLPEARPRLVQGVQGTAARFDGQNDFLIWSGHEGALTNLTIFIQTAPRSNKGGFRAFFATSRAGKNDYSSGVNVDFGFQGSENFSLINVEGAGFTGQRDLLKAEFPFSQTRVLTIASSADAKSVRVWLDGLLQEERPRNSPQVAFDLCTVGARFYSNTAEPAHVQGFLDGDISHVLIYSRGLSDEERATVERFLIAQSFSVQMPGRKLVALETVTNASPIRMFLPGFEVKELPVQLNNVNCVKYREDGKLVALGYDGNIWLLSDNNGDGSEDKAALFWNKNTLRAPIGLALTPPNYPRGRGVFVPSKGKLSLIVDTNRDDVADEEIIVAKGWNELPHGVDALGVALARDGSIYFGLGAANFTDAYLIDSKTQQAGYSLKSERGTILKVSPDFSTREIFCTGIRFPVAMAFNSAGDLFCTDQEGATWLPNGNPLDELLFIERGRHYGFPPRHPEHLPKVIDEPSVFDYTPQHQSTCGLNFNEPVNGGPVFGPERWRGDAFVTGYSRGKLYRTRLVKTKAGYVAKNQIIGSVNGLPADVCVSPQGELVVAVHSGNPDWGSGPTGGGKLYKVSHSGKTTPKPVALWASSPTETLVEFDQPLDATRLKDLKKGMTITQGRHVGAGDRFEIFRPGYQVVMNQLAEPRFELEIHSIALGSDGRNLAIRSASREAALNYAITLPALESPADQGTNAAARETIELAHDLSGVEAVWEPVSGQAALIASLPHLDLRVARELAEGSVIASNFWASCLRQGTVTLRTQLDLWQMLRAATQPGSKLDFEYPPETVTVVLRSDSQMDVTAPSAKIEQPSQKETRLTISAVTQAWVPVTVKLRANNSVPTLDVSWFTTEDTRPRALPLRRILRPWARPAETSTPKEAERTIPELAGGNWLDGRRIFFGEQGTCSKCHTVRGAGGNAGPDLSNLAHRDYASVLKDIVQPSAAINPDHVAYNIELKDGSDALNGVPAGGDDSVLLLADATGRFTPVARKNIRSMKPSTLSLMPEGLLMALSEKQRKDLLTFLLMPEPLQPAELEISGAPLPRKRLDVEAVVGRPVEVLTNKPGRIHIVLCDGPKDHGPGEHDYPLWQRRWSQLFALADDVVVEKASGWPTAEQFSKANVIVFYSNNPGWSVARASELDAFLNRGGGLAYIHFAVDGHANCEELAQRIGLAWKGGASAFRHGALDLKFEPHAITENFSTAHFVDESYWNLVGDESKIQLLASGVEAGKSRPLIWVREQGKGRVFVSIPGHYTWTFDDPFFRILILRGVAWTAHQPIDRFSELATIGARIAN